MEKQLTQRKFGLDIIRSVAILFVVFGHSAALFNPLVKIPIIKILIGKFLAISNILAFVGVELFFVLSGYLICKIIFKYFNNISFNFKTIRLFWLRRWLRTLPNYYLLLLINIILFVLIFKIYAFDWRFLFFIQNFWQPHPHFFREAWSLAIEEWFYILFPIILMILVKRNLSIKKAILITCVFFITFSLVFKLYYSFHFHYNDFDEYFRKIVLLRFDNLAIGILCYYFQLYFTNLWYKYKMNLFLFGLIIILFSIVGFYYLAYQNNEFGYLHNNIVYHYSNIAWLSTIGIGIACTFPFMENLSTTKFKFFNSFFLLTAKLSYAMYLLNMPLFWLIFKKYLIIPNTILKSFSSIFIYYTILYLTSYMLYRFFELPILTYRDKFFPNKH